ncbi:MAG: YfhO family protein [Oscillospiraceae bacterium]|nr:YfhO family protein [Oscillospiraceae bacterium]
MERLDRSTRKWNRIYRLLSFLIPLAALLICMVLIQFYPFGDNLFLRGDANAEYYPYIMLFRRVMRSQESLLYTWRSGMGLSLIPTYAYFGFNPFNLIAVLLPESVLPAFFSISICVRIALAGYFFSILLQTVRPALTQSSVVFSVMFALNSWLIGNSLQTVWLDSIMMLPLICAGLIRMVRDRDFRLYPIALGLCIAFNYYMGFIICVMTGLVWVGLMIVVKSPLRSLLTEALTFLGLSVVGAGIGGVLLIPTFMAIRQTTTYGSSITNWTEVYSSIQELIGGLAPFQDIVLNSHPGFYATSILAVMLLGGYILSGKIPLKERVYGCFLFVFLMLSFWYAPLNFVWHGLHYPHVSVQRFGFLVPFVLAFIGWRFTDTLHDIPEKPRKTWTTVLRTFFGSILMLGFGAGVIYCAATYCEVDIPLVIAICGGLYFLLYGFYRFFPKRSMAFYLFLIVLVSGELGMSAYLQNSLLSADCSVSTIIPDKTISQSVSAINSDDQMTPEALSRTAVMLDDTLDFELLYDIPHGSSVFNSMIPNGMQQFCEKTGLQNGGDGYFYSFRETTPFAMLLTDMQYVVANKAVASCDPMQENVPEDTYSPYKNRYDTDLGFCVPEAVQLPEDENMLGSDVLDQLFTKMTGIEKPLFSIVAEKEHSAEFMDLKCNGEQYSFIAEEFIDDAEGDDIVKPVFHIEYEIPQDGLYYLYYRWDEKPDSAMKICNVFVNDERIFIDKPFIKIPAQQQCCALGERKKGDKISYEMNIFAGTECAITVRLVRFDEDVYRKGYEIMHKSPLKLTSFDQDRFTGTVETEKDSVLYLSVPFEEGWTASVDGKDVPVERMLNAMSGIRVPAGKHQIRMQFMPPGLMVGVIVSASCIFIYLLIVLINSIVLHKHRRAAAAERGDAGTAQTNEQMAAEPMPAAEETAAELPEDFSVDALLSADYSVPEDETEEDSHCEH